MSLNLNKAVEDYISHCRYHKNLNSLSLKCYRIDLRQFLEFLTAKRAQLMVNKTIINDYISSLFSKRLKESSIRRKLISIKALFTYLENEGVLNMNPFATLRLSIRIPTRIPEVMSLEEVKSIISVPKIKLEKLTKCQLKEIKLEGIRQKNQMTLLREIVLLELLFATGMRVSELSQLNIQDIDVSRGVIRVHGKGSKERAIPVSHNEVCWFLNSFKNIRSRKIKSGKPLFINRFGHRLSTQSIRGIVKKYAQMAKLQKRVTPHTFRHTTATLLLEHGTDIRIVQSLLGHASITMTERYTHVTPFVQARIISTNHPRNLF